MMPVRLRARRRTHIPPVTPPSAIAHPRAPRDAHAPEHVPELDGLRGLAVLMTVATHWQAAIPRGRALDDVVLYMAQMGWMGVEIFFVLSGLLITGILLRARQQRPSFRTYLGRFMWRRALRIAPLYYAGVTVLFVALPAVVAIQEPAYWWAHAHQAWYWLYGVNWMIALHGIDAAPFLTGHFWSVAVEEQFYLVWPFLVWWAGPKRLPWLAGALWAGSIVARIPFGHDLTHPWHDTTPLHLDGLMVGALLAWVSMTPAWPRVSEWLRRAALPALALLVLGVLVGVVPMPLIAAAFGAVLVTTVTGPTTAWRVLCRASWLRRFGTYSYCIYLVHYPLMMVLERVVPRLGVPHPFGSTLLYGAVYGALLLGISTGVAALSWRYFERPLLALKSRGP